MPGHDLFRGPSPRLSTFDEWWQEVLDEKWLRDHITIGKPVFVGKMPQRVDLEVKLGKEPINLGFRVYMDVAPVIYWFKPKWWHPLLRLWSRIKLTMGSGTDTQPRYRKRPI